jgi:hypothetical protein
MTISLESPCSQPFCQEHKVSFARQHPTRSTRSKRRYQNQQNLNNGQLMSHSPAFGS